VAHDTPQGYVASIREREVSMMASPRRLVSAALGLSLVIALGPTALAGPPGKWTKVTDGTVVNFYEPGLFRTADGVLHVAFARSKGGADGYGHTRIAKTGRQVGSIGTILEDWGSVVEDPVLLDYRNGDGIRLVFSGINGGQGSPYNSGAMYTSVSTDTTGTSWNLNSGSMSQSTLASSGSIGATNDDTGVPMAAWVQGAGNEIRWHRGVDASNPATSPDGSATSGSGCCLYHSAMATDTATGDVWLAWYSNQSGAGNGTWVKKVYPTTAGNRKVPHSTSGGFSVDFIAGVAIAARRGGGVYTATCVGYPTCTKLQLWKVGTTKTWTIPKSGGATDVTIATAPQGRLWIAWVDANDRVRAVRTNTSATRSGPVRIVGRPGGASTIYQIGGEGSSGRMDVLVNVGDAMWHTQVLAALAMSATPKTFDNATRSTVRFVVSDARQPVKGARVSMGGQSTRTNSKGVAFLTFPRGFKTGTYTATAKKTEYYRATVKVKVT
jgi:hypothetical protein